MINQISPIQQKTTRLSIINKDLLQARHLQAKLKPQVADDNLPDHAIVWCPTALPYLVPIIRWIE